MKKILFTLFLSLSFFYACHDENLEAKFETLKDKNYSEFKNMSIINRQGVYFVTYHDSIYKVKRSFFSKKIFVEKANNENIESLLTKDDIDIIEHALKSFDQMKILSLSIDKNENILVSLPWYDRCTYYFFKLSSLNTLEELKKQYYNHYEGNWYIDKECSK